MALSLLVRLETVEQTREKWCSLPAVGAESGGHRQVVLRFPSACLPACLRQRLWDVRSRTRLAWPYSPPLPTEMSLATHTHTLEPELPRTLTEQRSLDRSTSWPGGSPRAVLTAFRVTRTLGSHGATKQQESPPFARRESCPFRPDSPR